MRGLLPALTTGLIVIAVVVLVAMIGRAKQVDIRAPGRRAVPFRYSAFLRWFAIFAAFGIPTAITSLVVAYPPRGNQVWYVIGAYSLFAALGLPLYWETSRYCILVTPDGIERRSAWNKQLFLAWDEIREVRYSSLNSWFVLEGESGQKIRISTFLGGLTEFLRLIEDQIPPERLRGARSGYERIGRPFPALGDEPILEPRAPRRQREW
jgi:hypothetical protein